MCEAGMGHKAQTFSDLGSWKWVNLPQTNIRKLCERKGGLHHNGKELLRA